MEPRKTRRHEKDRIMQNRIIGVKRIRKQSIEGQEKPGPLVARRHFSSSVLGDSVLYYFVLFSVSSVCSLANSRPPSPPRRRHPSTGTAGPGRRTSASHDRRPAGAKSSRASHGR